MAWLFKFKGKSKYWWIGHRSRGKQFMRSTGYEKREDAEKELEKVKAQIALHKANALQESLFEELTGRRAPTKTLKGALTDWINEARGATAPGTLLKYKAIERGMLDFFKADDRGPLLREVTAEELQRYLSKRRAVVSAATANMARRCLSVFFNRCVLHGLDDNPMRRIPKFKAGKDEEIARRPFAPSEVSALYAKAPDDFWRYLVLAGFNTGLRLGDLVTMPIGAVDFKKRTVNIKSRKTGATMHIPIAGPLLAMLKRIATERAGASPADPFWPEHAERYETTGAGWFSQRFYDLLLVPAGLAKRRPHRGTGKTKSERRNVNEVSFHCLRHSFVTTIAAGGHNQQVVKELAGHSSDEINDLYTKVPPAAMRLAVAEIPDITK